jgi:hypothetical protein
MNKMLFVFLSFLVLTVSCKVTQTLPPDAVVLEQIIYVDEVQKGTPQTIQMPNGTTVTYKMPEKLQDGQIIKIRDIPGERPYYIKVQLKHRNEK